MDEDINQNEHNITRNTMYIKTPINSITPIIIFIHHKIINIICQKNMTYIQ